MAQKSQVSKEREREKTSDCRCFVQHLREPVGILLFLPPYCSLYHRVLLIFHGKKATSSSLNASVGDAHLASRWFNTVWRQIHPLRSKKNTKSKKKKKHVNLYFHAWLFSLFLHVHADLYVHLVLNNTKGTEEQTEIANLVDATPFVSYLLQNRTLKYGFLSLSMQLLFFFFLDLLLECNNSANCQSAGQLDWSN